MTKYYDLVLGLIPVSLVGVSAVLVALGFELTTAVPLASAVAVGLIGHGMFVNGPVDDPGEARQTTDATQFQPGD